MSEAAQAVSFWIWQMRGQKSSETTARKPSISGVNDPPKWWGQLPGGEIGYCRENKPATSKSLCYLPSKWRRIKAHVRVLKISISRLPLQRKCRACLHKLSMWREEATESFHGRCRHLGRTQSTQEGKECCRLPSSTVSDIKKANESFRSRSSPGNKERHKKATESLA